LGHYTPFKRVPALVERALLRDRKGPLALPVAQLLPRLLNGISPAAALNPLDNEPVQDA